MNITKDFMLETMARAESFVHLREHVRQTILLNPNNSSISSSTSSSSSSLSTALKTIPDEQYLVSSSRTFEVTDLFGTFLGTRARTIYVSILSGYMYGALWAYSTVFAASFSANVPVFFLNNGNTCNIEEEGTQCLGPFFVWLAVFALLSIPLSCLELKEQVYVQVTMFIARLLVVLLMTGTALGGYACDGIVFADMSKDHKPDTPLFTFSGLATVMPVSIYAFIFHHSVPILSQPVKDKRSLPKVFRYAFIIVGTAYASLGLILAIWFGSHVDGQCNLNWRQYVGCVAPHSDGSPVTLNDRTTGAMVVSFVILIFPALDVLSAYPLNAITLGNNLLSAMHSNIEIGVNNMNNDEHDRSSSHSDAIPKTWLGWFASFRTMSRQARRRIMFRLIAAVPPVIAGALSTFYGVNLTQILSFTGLIGVAIAFGIPSFLRIWSFTRQRGILEELSANIAAKNNNNKQISNIDEDTINEEVENAFTAKVPWKAVLEKSNDDKLIQKTPYTNMVLKLGRFDLGLFVFAIGIAIFVLVGLIINGNS